MAEPVETKILRLAARILGGPRKLGARLAVPAAQLAEWLNGTSAPPREVLLKALDVILDDLDAGAPRLRELNRKEDGR